MQQESPCATRADFGRSSSGLPPLTTCGAAEILKNTQKALGTSVHESKVARGKIFKTKTLRD